RNVTGVQTCALPIWFGAARVARYLQAGADPAAVQSYGQILALVMRTGRVKQVPAGAVFARFLNYLRHVELPGSTGPLPEMSWFRSEERRAGKERSGR